MCQLAKQVNSHLVCTCAWTSHNYMYFGTHCVPYMDTKKVEIRSILNNASYFTSTCTLNMYMYILCKRGKQYVCEQIMRCLFGGRVGALPESRHPLPFLSENCYMWSTCPGPQSPQISLSICPAPFLNCSCTCKWNPESRKGDTTQQKDKATQHMARLKLSFLPCHSSQKNYQPTTLAF